MSLRSAYTGLTGAVDTAGNAASRLGRDLAGGDDLGKPWYAALRPASWRGVPFGVVSSDAEYGRRVAVHEYPYRDTVWVEDLGRGPRRISLTGFLVEASSVYGGGEVLTQRDQLQRACEGGGEGELVHPTIGRVSVALLRFRMMERRDLGRVVEVAFQFVEAGRLLYPGDTADPKGAVEAAADRLGLAAAADFAKRVGAALKQGAAIVRRVVGTVTRYVGAVMKLVDDATNLYHAITDLPGAFGRFFSSLTLRGILGTDPAGGIAALKSSTAASRSAVATAGATARTAAAATTTATVAVTAAAVQAHVEAAATAIPAPADRMRLMLQLSTSADTAADGSPDAAALYRRTALAHLARASAAYEPRSYDDAVTVRDRVTAALDAEILRAGDAGDDDTYAALRAVRAAVVADLTVRGASLAKLMTVTSAAALPSLVLAQRLYQDAAREGDLVAAAHPVHPAFMPREFLALSE